MTVSFLGSSNAVAKTSSPAQWAPKFCTALSTWGAATDANEASVESALSGLGTGVGALPNGKTLVTNLFAQDVSDTDALISALRSAGAPSSQNGTKIQSTFLKAFQTLRDASASAQTAAGQLPTDNAANFLSQSSDLITAYQKSSGNLGSGFKAVGKLDVGGKLSKALTNERSCKFLTKSSS